MRFHPPQLVSLAIPGLTEWVILIGMLILVIYAVTRIGRR